VKNLASFKSGLTVCVKFFYPILSSVEGKTMPVVWMWIFTIYP